MFFLVYISENYAAIFVIFGMHHANGSRKLVIKHFSCIFTAGVRNDDVTVTSVKMPFAVSSLGCSDIHFGWWRSPAVEHRSLAGVLSLSCARLVADG